MKGSRDASLGLLLLAASSSVACGSSDPTGSGGEGKITFTTWAEEYVEIEIPVDSKVVAGFVDGWSLKYEKFLVNFQNLKVADAKGNEAGGMSGSLLFNHHVKGVKSIARLDQVPAQAWEHVHYEIAPVTKDTERNDSATVADWELMLDGGYSFYVEGTATKADVRKHFAWGFTIGTKYERCHSEQDGKDLLGVVVRNNSETDLELTTHGDHLYYDRLQASPDPAIVTSLRFDALARADVDEDGEITLQELNAAPLDIRLYDPSGLKGITSQGAFVTSLARTIGHFRGEGECDISAL